jgi:hypothetical protein
MKTKYLILISVLVSTMTFAQLTSVSPNQGAQGQTLSLLVSGNIGWSAIFYNCSPSTGSCTPYFKLIEDAAGGGAGNELFGTIISSGNIEISIPAFQPIGPYDVVVNSCNSVGVPTIYTMPNSFYIGSITSIDEQATQKELLIVTDLLGRKTKTPTKNEPFLHIYNDGTVEKRIILNK